MKVYNLFLIANLANGLTINPASAQPSSDVSSQADGTAAAGGDGMKTKHSFLKGIPLEKILLKILKRKVHHWKIFLNFF